MESNLSPRIDWNRFESIAPGAVEALRSLGKTVEDSGMDKTMVELVKVRVSQLNGCAFCLGLHLDLAHRLGIPGEKLDLVAVWRDAGVFSSRERAALEWAERLAGMSGAHVADSDFECVTGIFSESEVVFLTVAIAHINAWNRIAGSLRFAPSSPRKRHAPGSPS